MKPLGRSTPKRIRHADPRFPVYLHQHFNLIFGCHASTRYSANCILWDCPPGQDPASVAGSCSVTIDATDFPTGAPLANFNYIINLDNSKLPIRPALP